MRAYLHLFFHSQLHTFILLPSTNLPAGLADPSFSKSSRQRPTRMSLLLLCIYQTEPQQEENGTMIHQQQERQKEKHHVKVRWDVIQFCLASADHQNQSCSDGRRGQARFLEHGSKRRMCVRNSVILQLRFNFCMWWATFVQDNISDLNRRCPCSTEGQGFLQIAILQVVQQSKTWHLSPENLLKKAPRHSPSFRIKWNYAKKCCFNLRTWQKTAAAILFIWSLPLKVLCCCTPELTERAASMFDSVWRAWTDTWWPGCHFPASATTVLFQKWLTYCCWYTDALQAKCMWFLYVIWHS